MIHIVGDPSVFESEVVKVLSALRPGEIMTYGEVAAEAGFPGAARAVGRVLRNSNNLPWWRIVTSTGRLVPGLEHKHRQLLESEGVMVKDGRIVN